MLASALDPYVHMPSSIHRLDARVKVVITLLFVVSNVALPDGAWPAFVLAWGLVLLSNRLAGLGLGYSARRSFVALPFMLAAVSAIVTVPGQPVAGWVVGPFSAVATDAGLVRFASIVVRSWLSVQMAILLVATTPFPVLLHALQHLHVPRPLIGTIALTYRYLFVVADEAARLLRARAARSAGAGTRGVLWHARIAGHMVGQLFLRSYERSERIYAAMLARGYRGDPRALHAHRLPLRAWAFLLATLGYVGLLQVLGRLDWAGVLR